MVRAWWYGTLCVRCGTCARHSAQPMRTDFAFRNSQAVSHRGPRRSESAPLDGPHLRAHHCHPPCTGRARSGLGTLRTPTTHHSPCQGCWRARDCLVFCVGGCGTGFAEPVCRGRVTTGRGRSGMVLNGVTMGTVAFVMCVESQRSKGDKLGCNADAQPLSSRLVLARQFELMPFSLTSLIAIPFPNPPVPSVIIAIRN